MASAFNTIMGYGLADVSCDGGVIVDGRISVSGYFYNKSSYNMSGFLEFMRRDNADASELDDAKTSIQDCIHVGMDNKVCTLCIVAPQYAYEWIKKDTSDKQSEAIKARTVLLDKGLPGFRHLMDTRNGRSIENFNSCLYSLFLKQWEKYNSPGRCDAEKLQMEYELVSIANDLGFSSADDAARYVAPEVPTIIQSLCAYLNIFHERSVALSLRPMVYSYAEQQ